MLTVFASSLVEPPADYYRLLCLSAISLAAWSAPSPRFPPTPILRPPLLGLIFWKQYLPQRCLDIRRKKSSVHTVVMVAVRSYREILYECPKGFPEISWNLVNDSSNRDKRLTWKESTHRMSGNDINASFPNPRISRCRSAVCGGLVGGSRLFSSRFGFEISIPNLAFGKTMYQVSRYLTRSRRSGLSIQT